MARAKALLMAVACALLAASNPVAALAQCAMCRASAQAGASGGAAVSDSLNLAILVLLIPPVLIFCTIFFIAYRYRKAMDEGPADSLHRGVPEP